MTGMSGKARVMAAWKGDRPDRGLFNVDIGPHYSPKMNKTTNDYFGNIDTAIEIQVKSVSDFTSDIITVPQNMFGWFPYNKLYRFKTRTDEIGDGKIKTLDQVNDMEAVPVSEIEGLKLLTRSINKINELSPNYASRVAMFGPMIDSPRMVGLEDWIAKTIEEPEFIHKLLRLTTDAATARVKEIIQNTPVDIVVVADTFASISNISPKIYKEFVFPYEMEMFSALKEAAGGRKLVGLHICGLVDPIMEEIAKLPIDWWELDGPSSLQKAFAAAKGKMMIRGNVGGEIFSEGSREQIYEAVKKCYDMAAGNPKYVCSTGCQIPLNAPLDQVRHFIDAALQYGVRQ